MVVVVVTVGAAGAGAATGAGGVALTGAGGATGIGRIAEVVRLGFGVTKRRGAAACVSGALSIGADSGDEVSAGVAAVGCTSAAGVEVE